MHGMQQIFNKYFHVNELMKINLGFLTNEGLIEIPIATMFLCP